MGGAKISEDNQKIIDDLQHLNGIEENNPIIIQYDCYYCNETLNSIEDRNEHIKQEHNGDLPLLLINGKIKENEYSVEDVHTAEIDLGTNIKSEISINDKVINFNGSKINLIPHLQSVEDEYLIKINQKSYKVWRWMRSAITNPCIDTIVKKWDNQTKNNHPLNPPGGDYPKDLNLNGDEINYLNGFNNYYLACKENINPEDREKRYLDSHRIFSKLKVILPSSARLVLNVIFFRWNWIKELEGSSTNSSEQFDVIVDFFYGRKSNQTIKSASTNEVYDVFIEPDIKESLDIIKAFQFGNWKEVDAYLDKWPYEKIEDIADNNKRERILFLKARRLKEIDRYNKEAEKYFKMIRCPNIGEFKESYR